MNSRYLNCIAIAIQNTPKLLIRWAPLTGGANLFVLNTLHFTVSTAVLEEKCFLLSLNYIHGWTL